MNLLSDREFCHTTILPLQYWCITPFYWMVAFSKSHSIALCVLCICLLFWYNRNSEKKPSDYPTFLQNIFLKTKSIIHRFFSLQHFQLWLMFRVKLIWQKKKRIWRITQVLQALSWQNVCICRKEGVYNSVLCYDYYQWPCQSFSSLFSLKWKASMSRDCRQCIGLYTDLQLSA